MKQTANTLKNNSNKVMLNLSRCILSSDEIDSLATRPNTLEMMAISEDLRHW